MQPTLIRLSSIVERMPRSLLLGLSRVHLAPAQAPTPPPTTSQDSRLAGDSCIRTRRHETSRSRGAARQDGHPSTSDQVRGAHKKSTKATLQRVDARRPPGVPSRPPPPSCVLLPSAGVRSTRAPSDPAAILQIERNASRWSYHPHGFREERSTRANSAGLCSRGWQPSRPSESRQRAWPVHQALTCNTDHDSGLSSQALQSLGTVRAQEPTQICTWSGHSPSNRQRNTRANTSTGPMTPGCGERMPRPRVLAAKDGLVGFPHLFAFPLRSSTARTRPPRVGRKRALARADSDAIRTVQLDHDRSTTSTGNMSDMSGAGMCMITWTGGDRGKCTLCSPAQGFRSVTTGTAKPP